MALLNPPELRPSVTLTIVRYLGTQRGQQDSVDRLLATLAPPTLGGANPQRDVNENLKIAVELGLILRSNDKVCLAEGVHASVDKGHGAMIKLLRTRVLDTSLNSTPWRSQVGARDLTNALGWFLTLPPSTAPIQMEGGPLSVEALQTRDFGARQVQDGEDSSNWPIGNGTRWNAFRRWACSLGFAWSNPAGRLVPDPTVAVRDSLQDVFGSQREFTAQDFIDRVGHFVPVVDGGRYREFVASHWVRESTESNRLTVPLTDALRRLVDEGSVTLDDRADAPRVAMSDGTTFSHVRKEITQ